MSATKYMVTNISCKPATPDSASNNSLDLTNLESLTGKDASWILTTAVIIFTMQTGFGLLEAGCVSNKSEVNIMLKNALDVVFGGITYWALGFGLSFGDGKGSNPFLGMGCFFVDGGYDNKGYVFAIFLFQLSFATTATTIVSGAMVERTKLTAYIILSLVNTIIYCLPAHWLWSSAGFLHKMGAVDMAGCGPVHFVGGLSGLVATVMLKPRQCAFKTRHKPPLPSPIKAIMGMFMLWWGWLRFSSGSVFILSTDAHWKGAVRAAVASITSSMAGGIMGVIISVVHNKIWKTDYPYDVSTIVNGVLSSLVSVTGICTLCKPWEALLIGAIGAILASVVDKLLWKWKVDDPVSVISIHGVCGLWGIIAIGLFLDPSDSHIPGQGGLLKTGQWIVLGVQTISCLTIGVWTFLFTTVILKTLQLTIGIRLSNQEEELGADVVEHGVLHHANSHVTKEHLDLILRIIDEVAISSDSVTFKPKMNLLRKALMLEKIDTRSLSPLIIKDENTKKSLTPVRPSEQEADCVYAFS